MFAIASKLFRIRHDQHTLTQVAYVSDESSLKHAAALPQIAAVLKSLCQGQERRLLARQFEGMSVEAGNRLRFDLGVALQVGQSSSDCEYRMACDLIPAASLVHAPRLSAAEIPAILAAVLRKSTIAQPFRLYTPLPSAARSLCLLAPLFMAGNLTDLADHLGFDWSNVVLPRLQNAASPTSFPIGCATWSSTQPFVTTDDIASIGSSTTPISRLALALLLDIVAVSVPAVTTLPWGSFNDLMANDAQASMPILDRCFRNVRARFVIVPFHTGHEAALLCYDCVLNTVHIYNSAPETTQGQAVEVAARGLGHTLHRYLQLDTDPVVEVAQTWKNPQGADSALVSLFSWLDDLACHFQGGQRVGLSTSGMDCELELLPGKTYRSFARDMMMLAQHACEAEILSLIMPALNTAGGIPPLDTFRRALTNAIGCPLTGDVNKLGFQLLTQSICIIQRSRPIVCHPVGPISHPLSAGAIVPEDEDIEAELCTDYLDTAIQAMAAWADGVLVASCNGIRMAQGLEMETEGLSPVELCLYLFGTPYLNLNGVNVVLFPILAGGHFFLVALTRPSTQQFSFVFDSLGAGRVAKNSHVKALVWIHQSIAALTDSQPMFSSPTIFTDMSLQPDVVSCGYFALYFAKVIINGEISTADWLTNYATSSLLDVESEERFLGSDLRALLGPDAAILRTYALTTRAGAGDSPFSFAVDQSFDDFKRYVLWAVHEHNELMPASLQPYPAQADVDAIIELA